MPILSPKKNPRHTGGEMCIATLNCFCRKYDVVFVEMGRVKGNEVYWFIDRDNKRVYYTAPEIESKITV